MKYVMRVSLTCPDGTHEGNNFWLADNEDEMKRMLSACGTYRKVTCLGPIENPDEWALKAMQQQDTPNDGLEARRKQA